MKAHILILSIAAVVAAEPSIAAACDVQLRLNAGGFDYVDPDGNLWISDAGYFDAGSKITTNNCGSVAGTNASELYETERWGQQMTYSIPVPPGLYRVRLHFAEIYWGVPDRRVFDVFAEGKLVLNDYDIFATAGGCMADVREATVQVLDWTLNISFVTVADKAKISAIEVESFVEPPVIEGGDTLSMQVPKNSSCPAAANAIDVVAHDSDAADAALLWSIKSAPKTGQVSFQAGVDEGSNVTLCYVPDLGQAADDAFVLEVQDGCGGSDEVTVLVTVANAQPVIAEGTRRVHAVAKGALCTDSGNWFVLTASDIDNDDTALTWRVRPGGEPATGTILFPKGTEGQSVAVCYQSDSNPLVLDPFDLEVVDAEGGSDVITVDVTVIGAAAPVVACPPNAVIAAGASTDPAELGWPTAVDDLDKDLAISFNDHVTLGDCPGAQIITRTWSAADAPGNVGTCEQRIFVDGFDGNGDGLADCTTAPPDPGACCGGGTPAALPLMLLGWRRRALRRRRR